MRTNTNLFCEGTSPQLKRLTLQKRAGIKLTEREQQRLNEVVSMVEPSKYHNRIVKMSKPIEEPSFNDIDDDEEIDLDEILKEMGYGEDNDDNGLNPSDFELTDEELQGIMDELEKDTDEELSEDKGYKEAKKLIKDLRSKLFRSLSDSELNSFMDELSNSFSLK